jgi:hypothetical protein
LTKHKEDWSIYMTTEFFQELSQKIGRREIGHTTAWFLELEGAEILIPTAFEPDPNTHRNDYYYNANTNALYKKVTVRDEQGIKLAYWQKASC